MKSVTSTSHDAAERSTVFSRAVHGLKSGFAEWTLVLVLVVFFVILAIASGTFLTINNLSNLVLQTSIVGIVTIGQAFVIMTAGIDLSVGATVGLAGIIAAVLMKSGLPVLPAVLVALIAGTLVGLVNGVIIYDGKVTPFIVTLGMMTAVRGVVMLISGANWIAGLPKSFVSFAATTFGVFPSLFLVWLVFIILSIVVSKRMRFGRNVFAIGSNIEAARLSGVSIRATVYGVYSIAAFLSAVAGVLLTSRLASGVPTAGSGYELDSIAAAVVGGASLFGGEGTILGAVLGALIIETIRNGGDLLGIDPFILQIAVGTLIVVAVLIDQLNKRDRA